VTDSSFAQHLKHLTDSDSARREAAREALLALDEDGVEWMIGEFYSGVSNVLGVALIEIIGEVGGWEALTFLRQVYAERDLPGEWQLATARALLRNIGNLDAQEVVGVQRYLARE
jgi:hypothetical protein